MSTKIFKGKGHQVCKLLTNNSEMNNMQILFISDGIIKINVIKDSRSWGIGKACAENLHTILKTFLYVWNYFKVKR